MPGMNFNASTASSYRYGFNGKENDNEVKGLANQIDYGMRGYDPRAGRFASVDPISREYPELTPYQFDGNSPITFTDQDGQEMIYTLSDGRTYISPPSDHLRIPVPTGATVDFPNTGVHKDNVLTNSITNFLVPPLEATNTLVGGRNVHRHPAQIVIKNGKVTRTPATTTFSKGSFGDFTDAAITFFSYGAMGDGEGGGEGGGGEFEGTPGEIYENPKGADAPKLSNSTSSEIEAGTSDQASSGDPSSPPPTPRFQPPRVFRNERGEATNGKYTVIDEKMEPHVNGDFTSDKSQFLYGVDYNKATLDAAAYADEHKLWDPKDNSAKVPVSNGNVGVTGRTGQLTEYINVYRKNSGYVHSSPGNPPSTGN